ncbi:sushi domain-containing protein 2-like [Anneissia japonica]|uniref:sushi domain-containing protein 2-like n=1 Tax=Anneissia japonica TaxID=1529436 RepID=UPI00142550B5|nr:sushi domain-containing protein 2-like [Anneissia japonica]
MFISFLVVASCFSLTFGDLYEYGTSLDQTLPTTTDAVSPAILLNEGFPFFQDIYWIIYVNENGLISFEHEVGEYSYIPLVFPQGPANDGNDNDEDPDERIIIAPFWANVDATSIGSVYYREDRTQTTLQRVSDDIRQYFVLASDFTANWAFVVTWVGVTFNGYNPNNPDTIPTNTFQTVLTTDGFRSYVLFIYDTITWTTGTDSGGNSNTGLGGTTALIGFNAGDGLRHYTVTDYSRKPSSTQRTLSAKTNCDEAGRFAYSVAPEVQKAGCSLPTSSVYPPYISMIGGDKLYLVGQCWTDDDMTCKFVRDDVTLQVANVTYESQLRAYCIPQEPFFVTGDVTVSVTLTGVTFEANVAIVESERFAALNGYGVTQVDSQSNNWRNSGKELAIEWDADDIAASDVSAEVLAYREDGDVPEWETVYTIARKESNDGSLSFTPSAMANVSKHNAFGVIRVKGSSSDPILYSKIHAFGYLLEEAYQEASLNWSQSACLDWYLADQTTPDYIENLPSCPCTLDQALADDASFQPDTGCSIFEGSVCTYHQGAVHCVRSIFPTSDNAGVQCCYSEEGDLMYAGDTMNGSTADRSHPWGVEPYGTRGKVPAASHWVDDVITFYFCCIWTDNSDDCWMYMERRPTADCRKYLPPTHASIFGDPHVYTFDGFGYTANLKGEYMLLTSTDSDGLQIQGRMEQIANYNGQTQQATVLTAIAMQGSAVDDVIQVELNKIGVLKILRKSNEVDVKSQKWIDFKGVSMVFGADFTGGNITNVIFIFDSGISVEVSAIPELMSLSVTLPPQLRETVSGFFGDADYSTKNDPFGTGGLSDEDLFAQANFLEVSDQESLFNYEPGKSHDYYRNETFRPLFENPPSTNIPSNIYSQIDEVCGDITYCEYDILTTGLLAVGEATKEVVDQYFLARNKSIEVIACPYIPAPLNGNKKFVGGQNNHLVGASITFYCDEDYILSGSTTRNCQAHGEWTGTGEQLCYYVGECGSLNTEHGYITVEVEEDDAIVAQFTCDEGYNMGGSSTRKCNGENWSGETTGCYDGLTPDQQLGLILGLVIPTVIITCLIIGIIVYKKRSPSGSKSLDDGTKVKDQVPIENFAREFEADEPEVHIPKPTEFV